MLPRLCLCLVLLVAFAYVARGAEEDPAATDCPSADAWAEYDRCTALCAQNDTGCLDLCATAAFMACPVQEAPAEPAEPEEPPAEPVGAEAEPECPAPEAWTAYDSCVAACKTDDAACLDACTTTLMAECEVDAGADPELPPTDAPPADQPSPSNAIGDECPTAGAMDKFETCTAACADVACENACLDELTKPCNAPVTVDAEWDKDWDKKDKDDFDDEFNCERPKKWFDGCVAACPVGDKGYFCRQYCRASVPPQCIPGEFPDIPRDPPPKPSDPIPPTDPKPPKDPHYPPSYAEDEAATEEEEQCPSPEEIAAFDACTTACAPTDEACNQACLTTAIARCNPQLPPVEAA